MLAQIRKHNNPLPNLIAEKEVKTTAELDTFLLDNGIIIPVYQLVEDIKSDQVSYFIAEG